MGHRTRRRRARWLTALPLALFVALASGCVAETPTVVRPEFSKGGVLTLPEPAVSGEVSVEEAIHSRRSVREYSSTALTYDEVGQVLWAAQGITDESGHRAAPSAGALYPLEVYLVVGQVQGLPAGAYQYVPDGHALLPLAQHERREALAAAAGGAPAVRSAPATLVIVGVYERTAAKYGDRAERYVHLEAGHAAENVYLECAALGLGTVSIGAFSDDAVREALDLPTEQTPLYLMPVGHPRP